MMKPLCQFLALAFLALPWAAAQAPADLDLTAVVKHFEDLYRSKSSVAVAELTVVRPRRERSLRLKMWSKGTEHALIVIQEPAREKGTATLKVERNLWNFLPRIRRTIRIPPSMMLSAWMGSDFTNDDLVRESSFSEDYSFELLGRSETPAGWRIRFTAKPDVVGLWSRFELVVDEAAKIPLEAVYYDRRDRRSRTIVWDDVRDFGGRKIPARMTLTPVDQEGHQTALVYHELAFDLELPDSTFSLSELERAR
ncbi:MAG: outer membrane lipoprotein-sorting protein [Rhodothermales bacterium]|jgi:outer membrane lipoprotein-sorting protein